MVWFFVSVGALVVFAIGAIVWDGRRREGRVVQERLTEIEETLGYDAVTLSLARQDTVIGRLNRALDVVRGLRARGAIPGVSDEPDPVPDEDIPDAMLREEMDRVRGVGPIVPGPDFQRDIAELRQQIAVIRGDDLNDRVRQIYRDLADQGVTALATAAIDEARRRREAVRTAEETRRMLHAELAQEGVEVTQEAVLPQETDAVWQTGIDHQADVLRASFEAAELRRNQETDALQEQMLGQAAARPEGGMPRGRLESIRGAARERLPASPYQAALAATRQELEARDRRLAEVAAAPVPAASRYDREEPV